MKRFLMIAVALGLGLFVLAEDAYAHGGAFRGPNGGVPPGMREPSDPEPPPPPPSDPGDPGGPTTPSEPDPTGPTTPTTPDTPDNSGAAPPPTLGPTTGPKKRPTSGSLSFDSWRFWWGYNNDAILNLKEEIYKSAPTSSSGMRFAGARDRENKQNPQRLTKEKVTREIIPALEERLQDPRDNEDVHGGALVALGKIGNSTHIPVFKAAMHNKLKNDRGQHIKLGHQATESAVLALGLLQNLDEQGRKAVREICLEAIADDELRTRERAWAAVSLGLQRDTAL